MRSTILLFLMLADSSVAACPTGETMRSGEPAYAAYPDGSVVELKALGAGMIRETTRVPDGVDFRMMSMGGLLIIDEVDLEGRKEQDVTRVTSHYPPEIDMHLPLRPEHTFEITAVNRYADGSDPEDEYIQVRSGSLVGIDVAGCKYEAFPVLLAYRWDKETFTSMMTHIPGLGISLEIARKDQGEEPIPFAPQYFGLTSP